MFAWKTFSTSLVMIRYREISNFEFAQIFRIFISGSSSAGEIGAVKNALSSLQKDVSNLKSNVGEVSLTAGGIDIQNAYNFGVFGLCLGAAAVILAVIAMIRRK